MGICLGRGLCQCKRFLQTAYPQYAAEDGQASPVFDRSGNWGVGTVLIDKEAFFLCLDWEFKR